MLYLTLTICKSQLILHNWLSQRYELGLRPTRHFLFPYTDNPGSGNVVDGEDRGDVGLLHRFDTVGVVYCGTNSCATRIRPWNHLQALCLPNQDELAQRILMILQFDILYPEITDAFLGYVPAFLGRSILHGIITGENRYHD